VPCFLKSYCSSFTESSDAGIEDGVVDVNSLVESLSREADKLRGLLPTAVSSKVRIHITYA